MSDVETIRTQDVLRKFPAYLRRPQLTAPSGLRSKAAWREWAILFILQFSVLIAVMLPLVAIWQKLLALQGPAAFDQLPAGWFLPLTVLIAPLLEELFFRSWLTGRPRSLWLMLGVLAVIGLMVGSVLKLLPALAIGLGFIGIVLAAIGGWFVLRKKPDAPRWFLRGFPVIFYAVIAGFAVSHLSNYGHWSPAYWPMVLPQLWIGTTLGYIRMRIGLPGSILAHICSNSAVLLLGPLLH